MRSWPSWLATVLGALLTAFGLFRAFQAPAAGGEAWGWLLLSGALLLAAGLHSLQATYDAWCGDDCRDGCSCCGDGCSCGDCACCGDAAPGAGAAVEHSH